MPRKRGNGTSSSNDLRGHRLRTKMVLFSANRREVCMLMFCIRHGESTYNAQGRVQGHLNIPLSELGRRQSAALAAVCKMFGAEAIFCSPLRRARETAEPIAAALALPIQEEPRLIEIKVGIFQG